MATLTCATLDAPKKVIAGIVGGISGGISGGIMMAVMGRMNCASVG